METSWPTTCVSAGLPVSSSCHQTKVSGKMTSNTLPLKTRHEQIFIGFCLVMCVDFFNAVLRVSLLAVCGSRHESCCGVCEGDFVIQGKSEW